MAKRVLQNAWKIIKLTAKNISDSNTISFSAATAFYTVLSLPSISIIAVMVAGSLYDQEKVRSEFTSQIEQFIGSTSAEQVLSVMNNASYAEGAFLAQVLGIATLIFSATTVFISLQNSMNATWHIKPKPDKGWLKFLLNRTLSLAMVASFGFLLLVSLVADTIIALFNDILQQILSDMAVYVVKGINYLVSSGLVILVFAAIYKVLPDAKIKWRDVWAGSILTAVLFTLGKLLIGLFIKNSQLSAAYGAAGSLVILLLWVYYSVIVFLVGAHFTFAYSQIRGRRIVPTESAVAVEVKEVETSHPKISEDED